MAPCMKCFHEKQYKRIQRQLATMRVVRHNTIDYIEWHLILAWVRVVKDRESAYFLASVHTCPHPEFPNLLDSDNECFIES